MMVSRAIALDLMYRVERAQHEQKGWNQGPSLFSVQAQHLAGHLAVEVHPFKEFANGVQLGMSPENVLAEIHVALAEVRRRRGPSPSVAGWLLMFETERSWSRVVMFTSPSLGLLVIARRHNAEEVKQIPDTLIEGKIRDRFVGLATAMGETIVSRN